MYSSVFVVVSGYEETNLLLHCLIDSYKKQWLLMDGELLMVD